MAEGGDQFPDEDLRALGRGVCLIQVTDSTGTHYKGTGFHYGGGWVMSNAHNFQDEARDDETTHSLIASAIFTFTTQGTFAARRRMAFIHHLTGPHLTPGKKVDFKNKDIAMIKLGNQYEYGRNDYEPWEIQEEETLVNMRSHLSVFAEMNPPEPTVNQAVYGIHFGGDDNNEKFVRSRITWIQDGTDGNVPMLHLDKPKTNKPLPEGSSGCPIMIKDNMGKYRLVGLHFAGDADDKDGTAKALQWTDGIEEHIGNNVGVSIILQIGTYFSNRAQENVEDARNGLMRIATDNQLTIYLSNGETFKQPQ